MCLLVSAIATDYNETIGVVASQRNALHKGRQTKTHPAALSNKFVNHKCDISNAPACHDDAHSHLKVDQNLSRIL